MLLNLASKALSWIDSVVPVSAGDWRGGAGPRSTVANPRSRRKGAAWGIVRLIVASLTFITGAASACNPVGVRSLQEEAKRSGLVMIVQVTDVSARAERNAGEPNSSRYIAKFRVSEVLKGNPERVARLSGGDGSDCGVRLVAGHYVLVVTDAPESVVRVFDYQSSDLGEFAPDTSWDIGNARIQALRNYVKTGEPIDDCLNWTAYDAWRFGRSPQEFERCKSVISSVLKIPEAG